MTDEELRKIAENAHDHIGDICTGKSRWTMTVPTREDDSDILFSKLADGVLALLDRVEKAEGELDLMEQALDLSKMVEDKVKKKLDWAEQELGRYDRMIAEVERATAEKAWDEGREAEELAWEHAYNGHPVPEGEVCDECVVENPYRKAVQS